MVEHQQREQQRPIEAVMLGLDEPALVSLGPVIANRESSGLQPGCSFASQCDSLNRAVTTSR